jgi:2-methylcitrate dehydratase PrpD
VLAAAEHHKLTGKETLEGFIFGWECGARLTQIVDYRRKELKGPTFKGWWHVGLIGPIAATTGVARMLKLDRKQAASAIGVASCAGSGFRRNMGMMAKAFHSGIAARQGVESVELAKMGFTGDQQIIEAPLGFLAAVCPPEDRDIRPVTERLGNPYVLAGKQRIKIYPMCNPAHPIIDAALRLHAQKSFTIDDIEGIDADLHTFSLLRSEPWDEETAGFSGAYAIAASLVNGKLTLDEMTEKMVHDTRVKALMKKIRHVPQKTDEKVTVKLKGGKTVVVDVHEVKRLTTQEGVSAKFRDCAARALPAASLGPIEEIVARLESEPNVDRLMKLVGG